MLDIHQSEKNILVYNTYRDVGLDFHSNNKRTISLKILVFVIIVFFVCSCNSDRKFNKTAWQQRGDLGIYPERKKMLKDLMNNHGLKGLNYTQLIDLLGEPDKYSDEEPNTVTYNIVSDYGRDIDPIFLKNLEVKFSSDSIVTDLNINEIKH